MARPTNNSGIEIEMLVGRLSNGKMFTVAVDENTMQFGYDDFNGISLLYANE